LLMISGNLLVIPFFWFKLCNYAKHTNEIPEQKKFALLRQITSRACRAGRVTIDSHGQENIPKDTSFILFPNHQGLFDVLAILEACDISFSPVSKIEIKNVPFLKQIFAVMKAQFMDRADIRQSMKVILEVAKEVKEGRNYLIFPEGTRSKKGNQPGEFKAGSFKSAMTAKCPIVPVAMINSFIPFDSHTTQPVTVQVHFLEPLYYEEYQNMKSTEIAQIVRERIITVIEANK